MGIATAEVLEAPPPLVDQADLYRLDATKQLDPKRRSELGQFLTPANVAQFMAALFDGFDDVRILEAGAGVGMLLAAAISEACERPTLPTRIEATAFEIDPLLARYLSQTIRGCEARCRHAGIRFRAEVNQADFIEAGVELLDHGLFGVKHQPRFTHAILNPPYKKLNSDSATRVRIRRVGIETSNLYTAFIALAVQLLETGGEIVAITPRSFCNGPYFRPFREFLLATTAIQRIHLFESRTAAFSDDEVLQENVIFHLVKGAPQREVVVSSSSGPDDDMFSVRTVPFEQIVRPQDPERFIHVAADDLGQQIADAFAQLPSTLGDLGLTVSTGKVVDFRAKEYLRQAPTKNTWPLIYPTHFADGGVRWPKDGKKPNALVDARGTADLWMPSGTYVLAKRFTSNEERRRVVAAIFDPKVVHCERVGFENHLNVFHHRGGGLDEEVARGLAAFLNSTLVDTYFRQFNGHTQVNATDLRNLRYPALATLSKLGKRLGDGLLPQPDLDEAVQRVLGLASMEEPLARKKRIEEALAVLKELAFPRQQQNERSALTLLALLDLKATAPWSKATSPLIGVTPIMDFVKEQYGKTYAPNTRETFRRQTLHQFLDAGLIVANPDDPERAVNSAKNVYQIEAAALALVKTFGTKHWESNLRAYLKSVGSLAARYAQARDMARIPVKLPDGQVLNITPGGQNELVQKIVEDFCALYAPGGHLIYVGDTGDKFSLFDETALKALGVTMDSHGKMPDVVVHRPDKNWLLLIEAVTSHGPVNPKRRAELAKLFAASKAGLVYVTAFLTRKAMLKYVSDISWETEVWVAESPEHMIHFDGERFLGPYTR